MIGIRFPTITEVSIATLVEAFYVRVRQHPALRMAFEAAIAEEEWQEHLATMHRFWLSVMLISGRYSGNPVAVCRAVAGIARPLFAEWLKSFTETAFELFDHGPASEFATKARRIATGLQLALFHRPGAPPEGVAGRQTA
jgi:hemoglobin